MRVNASELLGTLVGATIQSVTGSAVTVLDLRGSEVIVATEHEPERTSLPLETVQDALDRLQSAADVEISSPADASPWLAAVLVTLAAGHGRRVGDEDRTAAVDRLSGSGHPLTVDPVGAHRRHRRRRHGRRKIRRRAIAAIVVTATSALLGAAIVASTTEGGPVATGSAPEVTARSATERGPLGAAMGMAAEATASASNRRPVGPTKVTREATSAAATERRSARTKKAPKAVVTAGAPDAHAGRRVFLTTCKECHTLTPGDWREDKLSLADLRPSYSTTREKVTNGGAAMPAFKRKLSEQEIRNVAAFVAKVTGRGRDEETGVGDPRRER